MRVTRSRALICIAFAVAAAIVWYVGRDLYWREHPDAAFASITGRSLPVGVHATAYRHELTDNLFHTTHYFLLVGNPQALQDVVTGTGFERSDEDAGWVLPDMDKLFGTSLSRSDLAAGYEWDEPRNRWYVIFKGGESALYAH